MASQLGLGAAVGKPGNIGRSMRMRPAKSRYIFWFWPGIFRVMRVPSARIWTDSHTCSPEYEAPVITGAPVSRKPKVIEPPPWAATKLANANASNPILGQLIATFEVSIVDRFRNGKHPPPLPTTLMTNLND